MKLITRRELTWMDLGSWEVFAYWDLAPNTLAIYPDFMYWRG